MPWLLWANVPRATGRVEAASPLPACPDADGDGFAAPADGCFAEGADRDDADAEAGIACTGDTAHGGLWEGRLWS